MRVALAACLLFMLAPASNAGANGEEVGEHCHHPKAEAEIAKRKMTYGPEGPSLEQIKRDIGFWLASDHAQDVLGPASAEYLDERGVRVVEWHTAFNGQFFAQARFWPNCKPDGFIYRPITEGS